LFSGAGIGDAGYRAAGFDFLCACEIEAERVALAKVNFPTSKVLWADVRDVHDEIVAHTRSRLAKTELGLLTCTAPCQGMSKSGQGTLLRNVRNGKRPALDPRNGLILPALDIIRSLRPRWVVFENVIEMRYTLIEDRDRKLKYVLDVIFDQLGGEYDGRAYDVEFADYGIPQRRQRLITVLTREPQAIAAFRSGHSLIPCPTHAKTSTPTRSKWVSVMDAIGDFPPLDGRNEASATCPDIPFHRVPVLDPKKYEWIRHVPPGKSAFDNQCINEECRFQGNTTHGASHNNEGINRAHRDTPLYCQRCGSLLPRPYTETDTEPGGKRLMSGYTSAYKRMQADLPAPALTRNLSYPCSDHKLHPSQNRVLSLAEAMRIHVLDRYDFQWGPLETTSGRRKRSVKVASDSLIRLVIGESVPPLFFELLGRHILQFSRGGQKRRVIRRSGKAGLPKT
jgi:DNA (cytosine-5)-methyltransferase 1